jgi:hypothetical protein
MRSGALAASTTRNQAFGIIRSLIDEFRLVPEAGALAEQTKMFAGTRNCRDLLLLADSLSPVSILGR